MKSDNAPAASSWTGSRLRSAATRLAMACAALSGLASLPAAAQSLNPNQQSMSSAIRNPALPPAEDPALCPSLARANANIGLPPDQQALLDRCGRLVREPNAALKATALQEITAEELNAPAANAIDFGLAQRANIASRLISLRNAGSPLASLADPN
jgi:hypothetical protein